MFKAILGKRFKSTTVIMTEAATQQHSGLWDMSKSRHRNCPPCLKEISRHQSPINVRVETTEYCEDLQIGMQYDPIPVKARDDGFGELKMSLDKVGWINIRVPHDKRDLTYCATRGHL